MFPTDLKHFKTGEIPHEEMMNVLYLRWLDRVRDRAGVPFVITDGGRADGDPEPSGSAKGLSLHHRGCAVDLKTRHLTVQEKWKIMAAIIELSKDTPNGWKVEFEVVWTDKGDRHWHLGLDWTPGKEHEFIEADD